MRKIPNFPTLCALVCAAVACVQPWGAEAGSEFFETKIRPVLAEHCYECHSAKAAKVKGGLRVDGRQELLAGGGSGPAIVPGKSEASLLLAAITHRDPDLAMPPKKPRLPEAVIADFTRWINEGAEWPGEVATASKSAGFDLAERKKKQPWLWQAPRAQKIPEVKDRSWPLSTEDFFVLERLEKAGLRPATRADDRTWLRRVHFVITGLPPSRQEIRAFLSDGTAEARAAVVDRLLASPRFGERWARHWMDLVRYAESRGHESDFIIANAWHYREYLIRALNADVPYDQFVLEHVAGDLLPRPRFRPGTRINESVLATGWAFLGEENHSPVDIRADECERIDNKVDVFSKTFLGLTVACARCHDHKFDPIRAEDYYALSGYMLSSSYRQVRFEAMENNREMADKLARLRANYTPPIASEFAVSIRAGVERIAEDMSRAVQVISGKAEPDERLRPWAEHLRHAATNKESVLHEFAKRAAGLETECSPATRSFNLPEGARVIADYTRPDRQPWKVDGEVFGHRPLHAGEIVLSGDADNPIAQVMTYGAARRDPFWNRLKNAAGNENDSGRLAATARSGRMLRTPTVTLASGKVHYLIKGKTRVYAAVDSHLMVEGPLHGTLVKEFDSGDKNAPRWVTHDLSEYVGHRAHFEFGPDADRELEILMVVDSPAAPEWLPAAQFEFSQDDSNDKSAKQFEAAAEAACAALQTGEVGAEHAVIANWLVQNAALLRESPNAELLKLSRKFQAAEKEIANQVQWESRTAVAWFDGTGVDENILMRGNPALPGTRAARALPAVLGMTTKPADAAGCSSSSGRYELGLRLVDPANPLLARVFVNRVWHHVFGRGIVASVDNFGELGDRPTHPELLDHLAWEFMHRQSWSLKRLLKRLVLSQTFAMSSHTADATAAERDPSNVLLHRMPVRRLEGEVIRDALLSVSGRLSSSVGGPPEPVHLTEFLVGRGRPEKSGPLDGSGRRSVYLAVRRNFLPTFMQTFDAPTPFSTVGRRNVTNVPGQSLALMNDPLFHQQAAVWAERLLREIPAGDDRTKIQWLFESAYGRMPTEEELTSSLAALNELRQLQAGGGEAVQIWTELCHALLNANEFIYVQ